MFNMGGGRQDSIASSGVNCKGAIGFITQKNRPVQPRILGGVGEVGEKPALTQFSLFFLF
ncbi:hypothetical protein BMR05_14185 [Methylococcaceae bacterium HT4]|nr:hypothetical protein BMR05_14185 [Methylococcaceae bacterium HT4]TXL19094.1 hypothetical protein BMR06_11690 [Methylococcaceae bacterium HT5]TXL21786.1 hypothetical protein BMR03_12035 [Methylococcaceae bacterium HT2]